MAYNYMTIEQKAKAYDDAIKRAKATLKVAQNQKEVHGCIETIFPELKENKMEWIEKIRQELKSYLEHKEVKQISESDAICQWIAWLEKQGEPFDDNIITRDDEILQAISIGLTDAKEDLGWSDFGGIPIEEIQNWLEKQGNPTDEDMKEALRTEYEKGRADAIAEMQKEWSEEDEEYINYLIEVFDGQQYHQAHSDEELVNWLKSLKQRYFWKPSDEQMEALNDVISSRDIKYDVLSELWKDLNTLKRE